ncbi:MAG: hypothetical protein ABIS69_10635 [Sediminibacterium sp.]
MKHTLKQVCVAWLLMPVVFSCATYNNKMNGYYAGIRQGDYRGADNRLSGNRFLQQDRNRLLFYFEKGKLYHMLGLYDSSNLYFNLADKFIESKRITTGDVIVSNLLNPMVQAYLGEDHERFLVHYYKALNYLYMGSVDDAVVEARRITLSTNALEQKFKPNANRYTEDAFALIVQAMIYEVAGDINNAFIAYRNATDLFLAAPGATYYGVHIPEQLQMDLLRTADLLGFADQLEIYQKKLKRTFTKKEATEGGEVIVFFERGMGPVKTEQNFILTQNGNGSSDFIFTSQYGVLNIPFDYSYTNRSRSAISLNKFRTVRVAIPSYITQLYSMTSASVIINGQKLYTELAEDINTIAPAILRERIVKEVSSALVRQVVKKLAEFGATDAAKGISKSSSKEKSESKKEANAEAIGLAAGLLVNIFNTATEKADTRNWQTLPAFIQYVRVPLQKGENVITLQAGRYSKTITLQGTGKVQMYNWSILR